MSVETQERAATYRGVVYPWQCDHMGHMNVMWYVGKFDEATWNLMAEIGLTPEYLRNNGRGMAAVQQEIAYKLELVAGATVSITSEILELRNKAIRFRHVMRDGNGAVAAETILTGVHIDTGLRKSCAFAQQIREQAIALFPAMATA